jgi:hypothetical protein
VTRLWLAAALVALAAAARAEPAGGDAESLIRWEWRIRWLQDVPELNLLVRNQTEREVAYAFRFTRGKAPCSLGEELDGVLSPRGWSHRSVPLVELRGKLPCDVPVRVVAHFASESESRTTETAVALAARAPAPVAGALAPADVALRAEVEDGCSPGMVAVRLLVESHSMTPAQVRTGARGTRCSDGTEPTWDGIERAALDLPAGGWAVFVDRLRAPTPKLWVLRGCTGWIEVENGPERAPIPLGRIEFPLFPEHSSCRPVDRPNGLIWLR